MQENLKDGDLVTYYFRGIQYTHIFKGFDRHGNLIFHPLPTEEIYRPKQFFKFIRKTQIIQLRTAKPDDPASKPLLAGLRKALGRFNP